MAKKAVGRAISLTLAALVLIAGFFILGANSKQRQNESPTEKTPPGYTTNADIRPSRSTQAPEQASQDLSYEKSLERIKQWAESDDALAQQFPLYDTIARTASNAFPKLGAHLLTSQDEKSIEAREVLYLRWRDSSPESLLRFRHENLENFGYSTYYNTSQIIERMARDDLSHTLQILKRLEQEGAKLIREYRALYRYLSSNPTSPTIKETISTLERWAAANGETLRNKPAPTPKSNDPEANIDNILEALSDEPDLANRLFNRLAKSDVDSAIELALSIKNKDTRNHYLGSSIQLYAEKYPHESIWLLPEIFRANDYFSIHQTRSLILKALATDPTAAETWFETKKYQKQISNFLRINNNVHPHLLPLLAKQPDTAWKREKVRQSLQTLANEDYAAADSWMANNLSPEEATSARLGLLTRSFQHDKKSTIKFVESIQGDSDRREAIRRLAQHWSAVNFREGINWAQKLEDPQDQAAAMSSVAYSWVANDFEAAKRYSKSVSNPQVIAAYENAIFNHLRNYDSNQVAIDYILRNKPTPSGTSILNGAISNLAVEDPHQALNLIRDKPELAYNASSIAHQWMQTDPDTASSTLLSEGGKIAENSIHYIVDGYANFSPEALLDLNTKISTPTMREKFLTAVRSNSSLRQYNPKIYEALVPEVKP